MESTTCEEDGRRKLLISPTIDSKGCFLMIGCLSMWRAVAIGSLTGQANLHLRRSGLHPVSGHCGCDIPSPPHDSIVSMSSINHALVLGASGISGWRTAGTASSTIPGKPEKVLLSVGPVYNTKLRREHRKDRVFMQNEAFL